MIPHYFLASIALLLLPLVLRAQAQCDQDKSCVGTALTIQRTTGKGAQYVDIDRSAPLRALDTALTFEAWLRPSPQPGRRQYVAGLWGPNRDNNDQWVVYIEDTRITFALSASGSRLGDADNTIATAIVTDLYTRGWVHLAAVWSGASTAAQIYIDGYAAGAPATNPTYPLRRLHQIENSALPLQLASTNALFDDTTAYRSFLGQMDEVRIWHRALSEGTIRCQRLLSLAGNESGLALYYRCNDGNNADLCDATNNGARGRMRSGAACRASDRTVPLTFSVSPPSLGGVLACTSDTTLAFTLLDTSICGSQVSIRVTGTDASLFTPSANALTLAQGSPTGFTVRLRANVLGPINATLEITNAYRCGSPLKVPLAFNRTSDLSYSKSRLAIDTLFVGCIERTFAEDTVRLCNTTGGPLTIRAATLSDTVFRFRPSDPTRPLPVTLAPGECWDGIVRMNAGDTTRTAYDTLRIASDDRCPGSGFIPVTGHSQDVFDILHRNGRSRLTTMAFEAVCPGQLSNVQLYQLRNMVSDSVALDSIIYPRGFLGRRITFPFGLAPNVANTPEYARFKPDAPGPFAGVIRFIARYRGCTIEKTITVTGRGISVDVAFDASVVGFGSVTVGKARAQQVTVTNRGLDSRRMSAYLKVGDVFRITAGRTFTIAPAQTLPVTLEFRPREQRTYYDTLCVFDEQCYGTYCIPISGDGVFEMLSFDPAFLALENVPGCKCATGTINVRNNSAAQVTFTSATLDSLTRFTLVSGPPSGTLAPGASAAYEIRYCPNDLNDDRADRTYLSIRLSDGQLYQVLVRASSVVPRLYVTPLTTFGRVEVGWTRTERILVENVSNGTIRIDAPPSVPAGYSVVGTTPALPATLDPRDSLWIDVRFAPTASGAFNGAMTFNLTEPCTLSQSGQLSGSGDVVKLDVPLTLVNYGLVKPCDCAEREVPMPNGSNFVPISIDSIWIDGAGVSSPRPAVFRWRSKQTGGATLPYAIAPQTQDTLLVSFCPNIPAVQGNVLSNAMLHIKASTPGWSQEFKTTLSGRRELNFQPNRATVQFPATRVDTAAPSVTVDLTVPDEFANPSGDSVVITALAFRPDQRVFSARAANGRPLPWTIRRGERFPIIIDFYPRAPKLYVARLEITTAYPCAGVDTTILVRGEGFAPAFGLALAFDTARVGRDTMRLTTCDTLELPIVSNRQIPQQVIDLAFRIGYDSTMLRLLDIRSKYTALATIADTGDGARGFLRDAWYVGADTVALVRFAVIGGPSSFPITLDSIEFDSDSLMFYKIITGGDRGTVIIDEPRIAISAMTAFDTVNVRSCADRIVYVSNPGAIPVRFDSLAGLPPGHRITASTRPIPSILAPRDSVAITVTYCAFTEAVYDATLMAVSNEPCPIADTGRVQSVGFAPRFPLSLLFDTNIGVVDEIRGTIADTIEVPILVDRDIPQTPLDIDLFVSYNRRALQQIGATSAFATPIVTESTGGLNLRLEGCDSITSGELARLRFVVAVPDTVLSPIRIDRESVLFASDSAFWVKLVPSGDTARVAVDGRCNITRLNFRGGLNRLSAAVPNPASTSIAFEVEFVEDGSPRMSVHDANGREVAQLMTGDALSGGRYRLELDVRDLSGGVYYCVFDNGRFRAVERFVVAR
jgi:hypothetical protein